MNIDFEYTDEILNGGQILHFEIRNHSVINTSYNIQRLLFCSVDSFSCIHPIISFSCYVICRTRIHTYMRWEKILCYTTNILNTPCILRHSLLCNHVYAALIYIWHEAKCSCCYCNQKSVFPSRP